MSRKGLGKGLDSLIPKFYDEDFDSNSTQSLEDILNDIEEKTPEEEKSGEEKKNIFEELEEEGNDKENDENSSSDDDIEGRERIEDNEAGVAEEKSEDVPGDERIEDGVQDSQKIQVDPAHVDEVKEIVNKNPRITLWSARSSAVFRYLRKTEPEFSISKEASTLIDEAVSKKYPEIWDLFDDY